MSIQDIKETFEFLTEWEDKYRFIIDLGKKLPAYPESERTAANKVEGCQSQVWIITKLEEGNPPIMNFIADSDAHIVKGLIAIVLEIYSGKTAEEILETDALSTMAELGLDTHLSPTRKNGLSAMVQRIRSDAAAQLEKQSS